MGCRSGAQAPEATVGSEREGRRPTLGGHAPGLWSALRMKALMTDMRRMTSPSALPGGGVRPVSETLR